MTSAQVVETSVTNNSSFQNYPHPDDHTIRTNNSNVVQKLPPFWIPCRMVVAWCYLSYLNRYLKAAVVKIKWPHFHLSLAKYLSKDAFHIQFNTSSSSLSSSSHSSIVALLYGTDSDSSIIVPLHICTSQTVF